MKMKHKKALAVFCCMVLLVSIGCPVQSNGSEGSNGDTAVVSTEYGKIRGSVSDDIVSFKGVPFAKPPVGKLRFAPPEKPEAWDDVLACKEFKQVPSQTRGDGVFGGQTIPLEDQDVIEFYINLLLKK